MGSKKCVIKTRCDYHSCHRLTLCGSINHQQFHCSHSTLHGRDSRWYISKILVGKRSKSSEKRSTNKAILQCVCVCVCLKYDWANTSEDWKHCEWLTSLLITEQPIMLGFGSSSEDIQRSWKLEIQSMSEKNKKNLFQEPSRFELSVMAPQGMYIFPTNNKPSDVKLKQKS